MNHDEKPAQLESNPAQKLPWAAPRLTVADIDAVTNNAGSIAPDYSGEMQS